MVELGEGFLAPRFPFWIQSVVAACNYIPFGPRWSFSLVFLFLVLTGSVLYYVVFI